MTYLRTKPRLPGQPLLQATGLSATDILRRLGTKGGALAADLAGRGLTPDTADRVAVHFGYTPGEIWGADWWNLPDGSCGPATMDGADERRARNAARKRARRQRRHNEMVGVGE